MQCTFLSFQNNFRGATYGVWILFKAPWFSVDRRESIISSAVPTPVPTLIGFKNNVPVRESHFSRKVWNMMGMWGPIQIYYFFVVLVGLWDPVAKAFPLSEIQSWDAGFGADKEGGRAAPIHFQRDIQYWQPDLLETGLLLKPTVTQGRAKEPSI